MSHHAWACRLHGALLGNVGAEMKTYLSCLHSFALSLLNLQSRFNICMRNVVQFI